MMPEEFDFRRATFTYFISSKEHSLFESHTPIFGGKLIISHSKRTEVITFGTDRTQIHIIGFCVDSHGELERREIPRFLLENCEEDVLSLIRLSDRLAGKFIILYGNQDYWYVFGDPTGSLPVHYYTGPEICLSSCDNLVAQWFGLRPSPTGVQIRRGSHFSQPMPYDITVYDGVKLLLPYHYLDLSSCKPSRFGPNAGIPKATDPKEVDKIVDRTTSLVDNIARAYSKEFSIICPLSGGYDSRVVLAFVKRHIPGLECYTFKHPGFTEKTGDYYVPRDVCRKLGLTHHSIPDLSAPLDYVTKIKEIIGEFHSEGTINLAYTLRCNFPEKAIVSGDVLDQIGKSYISADLPSIFATPSFFTAKQHNSSRPARLKTKEYVQSLKEHGYKEELYDLFAIENRLGRWSAQTNMIYSVAGINLLNIFNCREIIEAWMRVPRSLRNRKIIHLGILQRIAPELLTIPFNPTDRFGWVRKSKLLFLLATYGKWYLQILRDRIGYRLI